MNSSRCTRIFFVITLLLEMSLCAKQARSTTALFETLQSINTQLKQQIDNNIIIPSAQLRKLINIAQRAVRHLNNKGNTQQKSQAQRIISSIAQKKGTMLTRAQERKHKVTNALTQLRAIKNDIVGTFERGEVMGDSVIQEKLATARELANTIDELGNKSQKQTAKRNIMPIVQARRTLFTRIRTRGGNDFALIGQLHAISKRFEQAIADGTVIPRKQIKNELLNARRLAHRLDKLTSEQQKKEARHIILSITQNKITLMERAKQHAAESAVALEQLRTINQKLAHIVSGMNTTVDLKSQMETARQLAQKLDLSGTPAQKQRARKLILSTIGKRNRLIATANRHDGVFRETSNVKELVSLWSDMLERAQNADRGELAALFDGKCEECISHARQLTQNVYKRKKEARRLVEDMLEAKHHMLKVARKQKLTQQETKKPKQKASIATTIEIAKPKITTIATQEPKQIKHEREQEAEQHKREKEIIDWLHNVIAQLSHEATSIQQTGRITISARTLHEITQETAAQVASIVTPQNADMAQKLLASVNEGRETVRDHAKGLIQRTEKSFHQTLATAGIKDIKTLTQQGKHFIRTVRNGVPERAFAMEDDLYDRLAQLEHEQEQRMAHKEFATDNTSTAVQIASAQEVAHTHNDDDYEEHNDEYAAYEPTELDLQSLIDQKLHKLAAAPNKSTLKNTVHELGSLFRSLEKKFEGAHELVQKNRKIATSLLHDWNNRHKPSSRLARMRNWFKRGWNNLKTLANVWHRKKMKA